MAPLLFSNARHGFSASVCSDVVVMKEGKILEETTPVKLFADVKEEYSLEVPTFYAVMQELVKRGCPLDISKINNVSDLAKMLKSLKEKV